MKIGAQECLLVMGPLVGRYYNMVLRKRVVDVPLTGGVNQKIDGKNLPAPGFLTLENVRFDKEGSIQKRYGYTNLGMNVLSGVQSTSNVWRSLLSYKNELLRVSNQLVDSYAETQGGWVNKDYMAFGVPTVTPETGIGEDATGIDSITQDNTRLTVWLENGTYYYKITDVTTGVATFEKSSFKTSASNVYPRLAAINNYMYIFYNDGNDLKYQRFSSLTPAFGASTGTIYSDVNNSANAFEVTSYGNYLYLTYLTTTSTTCRLSKLDIDLTVVATNTFTANPNTSANFAASIYGANRILISWYDGTNVKSISYNFSLAVANATTTNSAQANIVNLTHSYTNVFYTQSNADTKKYKIYSNAFTSTAGSESVFIRSVGLASRRAAFDTTTTYYGYVVVLHESTLQSTYFLISSGNGKVICKFAAGKGTTHSNLRRLGNLTATDTTNFSYAAAIKGRIESENATVYGTLQPYSINLNVSPADGVSSSEANDVLFMSPGNLLTYDGNTLIENGFFLYPEDVSLAGSAGAGSIANGTYLVYAVYEWTDYQGNRHQSAPSIAQSITLGGSNDTITVTVPSLRLTRKTAADIKIRCYITENGGTTAYNSTYAANDATADTVAITLTTDPASLTSNEILYTTGGQVENISAPSNNFSFIYDNRIVVTGLEDPNQIRFSKNIKPLTGIGFNEDYLINLDPFGGSIKGGGALENAMVIFKETAIYAISGSGPNDTGANSTFSAPQLISADVGCRDPRSILQTPEGIYFMSNKGIYLIDTGLNLTYIGYPVEDYNSHTIVSATVITNDNEIRFATNSDVILVYNTFFKRWSISTASDIASATMWKGTTYTYITQSDALKEDSSTYKDNGSHIRMTVRTAWIKLSTLQGFFRAYRLGLLGTYYTNNSFNIKLYYNYSDIVQETHVVTASDIVNTVTWGDSATWGADSYWGGGQLDEVFQLRKHLKIQKCESISIEIFDSALGNNTGQGFSIEGINLELGGKGGIFRNQSTRSI